MVTCNLACSCLSCRLVEFMTAYSTASCAEGEISTRYCRLVKSYPQERSPLHASSFWTAEPCLPFVIIPLFGDLNLCIGSFYTEFIQLLHVALAAPILSRFLALHIA